MKPKPDPISLRLSAFTLKTIKDLEYETGLKRSAVVEQAVRLFAVRSGLALKIKSKKTS
jgi:hypothetical protein